ncbi:MAG: hypothetical protein WA815_16545, partial [Terracidiphilus sp.]
MSFDQDFSFRQGKAEGAASASGATLMRLPTPGCAKARRGIQDSVAALKSKSLTWFLCLGRRQRAQEHPSIPYTCAQYRAGFESTTVISDRGGLCFLAAHPAVVVMQVEPMA